MKLNVGLSQRQTLRQSLVMAPQLIQSLKMLQMPALKLEQKIRQELAINPMLEEVEELEAEQDVEVEQEAEFDVAEPERAEEKAEVDWDQYLFDDEEGYKVRETRESDEDRFEGTAAASANLYDHLNEQLMLLKLSEEEQLIGEYIIGNVAPDGYLSISVPEMAKELKTEAQKIQAVLEMIQRFDPTGVAARDLRECLLIQLREKALEGTLAWRIVDEHINELDRKSILQVAKMMNVPVERAQAAMETIRSLSPKPAQGRFDPAAMPVVPDLIVERIGDEFVVYHNDSHIPRLQINSGYKSLMRRGRGASPETREYIKQKLEQARWLLNAINQRRSTMIRVMEAIVERQREFFERGQAFLRPLIMEDVAQMVSMNVATISRVSNGKYVQTPLGVYEIKYFFNSGIQRENGDEMSKRSVKQRIEEIIAAEPPDKPLSDQEIYRILNTEGIKLARRTVTKYREELKIQPARLRKRVG
ncbi:MAG TPA: RNA polymerase factor sigma-54 [candidate division Zixibacteria bacterium]|nr:RNA polymerase factor sigma-54 [candidate division Zixibacteria bacterium]MDD4916711.1 RNA polymerase factor sigma-54 [candidate division Zixibacteria bacterium]MDM7972648.1 RNA polymerase factor sigma-54 [candidate division Zixibacteria bacterium]HOZ07974.1 RNA polymerase factor sigma-54 [candidate division Zixibacteria bacterium]HPM37951.1 RNA polymerase factor sigma-54 [candidate division Zixibacteria bacterium]